jgi:hypothetical protein
MTCAEYAEEHAAEACPKGPETSRKCAAYKGTHRAGSQQCEIEQKERQRAEYTRNHAQNHYQYIPASLTLYTPNIPALPALSVFTQPQSQAVGTGWQPTVRGRRGRPTQLSQAARDPTQTRIPSTQIGKRKERDFTSPTPPERITRTQSQPPSETRNPYGALDSLSDMDTDRE